MYNIGISEIIITDRLEDDKHLSIKYKAEAVKRPECINPSCSHKTLPNRHDSTSYLLYDVKAEGKLVYIDLRIRRYKCPECQTVFPDAFTFFTKRQHMTHRLKKEFVDRCIKGETFRYIANDYHVDSKTVAAAFQEYVNAHKELLNYSYTPEILGIDEAHIDDHYRLVLTDIKGQKLLDIKPDNKRNTIAAYLKNLDKHKCRGVTMDFAPQYASAVSALLPNALIVVDKFHVVHEINKCLDNLRRRIQREHLATGEKIGAFKHSKNLFMSNWEDLTPQGESRLSQWFNDIPEFYEGYMCKEMFRDIYHIAETKKEATIMFNRWLSSIPNFPEFEAMKKTMIKRQKHILNYWDCSWTNAYTESVNNAIKTIEKRGRGYKFARLREMCILSINNPKPEKFDPRSALYHSVNENDSLTENQKNKKISLYLNGIYPITDYSYKDILKKTNASIDILFEVYTSLDLKKNFLQRMTTYYKILTGRNLLS